MSNLKGALPPPSKGSSSSSSHHNKEDDEDEDVYLAQLLSNPRLQSPPIITNSDDNNGDDEQDAINDIMALLEKGSPSPDITDTKSKSKKGKSDKANKSKKDKDKDKKNKKSSRHEDDTKSDKNAETPDKKKLKSKKSKKTAENDDDNDTIPTPRRDKEEKSKSKHSKSKKRSVSKDQSPSPAKHDDGAAQQSRNEADDGTADVVEKNISKAKKSKDKKSKKEKSEEVPTTATDDAIATTTSTTIHQPDPEEPPVAPALIEIELEGPSHNATINDFGHHLKSQDHSISSANISHTNNNNNNHSLTQQHHHHLPRASSTTGGWLNSQPISRLSSGGLPRKLSSLGLGGGFYMALPVVRTTSHRSSVVNVTSSNALPPPIIVVLEPPPPSQTLANSSLNHSGTLLPNPNVDDDTSPLQRLINTTTTTTSPMLLTSPPSSLLQTNATVYYRVSWSSLPSRAAGRSSSGLDSHSYNNSTGVSPTGSMGRAYPIFTTMYASRAAVLSALSTFTLFENETEVMKKLCTRLNVPLPPSSSSAPVPPTTTSSLVKTPSQRVFEYLSSTTISNHFATTTTTPDVAGSPSSNTINNDVVERALSSSSSRLGAAHRAIYHHEQLFSQILQHLKAPHDTSSKGCAPRDFGLSLMALGCGVGAEGQHIYRAHNFNAGGASGMSSFSVAPPPLGTANTKITPSTTTPATTGGPQQHQSQLFQFRNPKSPIGDESSPLIPTQLPMPTIDISNNPGANTTSMHKQPNDQTDVPTSPPVMIAPVLASSSAATSMRLLKDNTFTPRWNFEPVRLHTLSDDSDIGGSSNEDNDDYDQLFSCLNQLPYVKDNYVVEWPVSAITQSSNNFLDGDGSQNQFVTSVASSADVVDLHTSPGPQSRPASDTNNSNNNNVSQPDLPPSDQLMSTTAREPDWGNMSATQLDNDAPPFGTTPPISPPATKTSTTTPGLVYDDVVVPKSADNITSSTTLFSPLAMSIDDDDNDGGVLSHKLVAHSNNTEVGAVVSPVAVAAPPPSSSEPNTPVTADRLASTKERRRSSGSTTVGDAETASIEPWMIAADLSTSPSDAVGTPRGYHRYQYSNTNTAKPNYNDEQRYQQLIASMATEEEDDEGTGPTPNTSAATGIGGGGVSSITSDKMIALLRGRMESLLQEHNIMIANFMSEQQSTTPVLLLPPSSPLPPIRYTATTLEGSDDHGGDVVVGEGSGGVFPHLQSRSTQQHHLPKMSSSGGINGGSGTIMSSTTTATSAASPTSTSFLRSELLQDDSFPVEEVKKRKSITVAEYISNQITIPTGEREMFGTDSMIGATEESSAAGASAGVIGGDTSSGGTVSPSSAAATAASRNKPQKQQPADVDLAASDPSSLITTLATTTLVATTTTSTTNKSSNLTINSPLMNVILSPVSPMGLFPLSETEAGSDGAMMSSPNTTRVQSMPTQLPPAASEIPHTVKSKNSTIAAVVSTPAAIQVPTPPSLGDDSSSTPRKSSISSSQLLHNQQISLDNITSPLGDGPVLENPSQQQHVCGIEGELLVVAIDHQELAEFPLLSRSGTSGSGNGKGVSPYAGSFPQVPSAVCSEPASSTHQSSYISPKAVFSDNNSTSHNSEETILVALFGRVAGGTPTSSGRAPEDESSGTRPLRSVSATDFTVAAGGGPPLFRIHETQNVSSLASQLQSGNESSSSTWMLQRFQQQHGASSGSKLVTSFATSQSLMRADGGGGATGGSLSGVDSGRFVAAGPLTYMIWSLLDSELTYNIIHQTRINNLYAHNAAFSQYYNYYSHSPSLCSSVVLVDDAVYNTSNTDTIRPRADSNLSASSSSQQYLHSGGISQRVSPHMHALATFDYIATSVAVGGVGGGGGATRDFINNTSFGGISTQTGNTTMSSQAPPLTLNLTSYGSMWRSSLGRVMHTEPPNVFDNNSFESTSTTTPSSYLLSGSSLYRSYFGSSNWPADSLFHPSTGSIVDSGFVLASPPSQFIPVSFPDGVVGGAGGRAHPVASINTLASMQGIGAGDLLPVFASLSLSIQAPNTSDEISDVNITHINDESELADNGPIYVHNNNPSSDPNHHLPQNGNSISESQDESPQSIHTTNSEGVASSDASSIRPRAASVPVRLLIHLQEDKNVSRHRGRGGKAPVHPSLVKNQVVSVHSEAQKPLNRALPITQLSTVVDGRTQQLELKSALSPKTSMRGMTTKEAVSSSTQYHQPGGGGSHFLPFSQHNSLTNHHHSGRLLPGVVASSLLSAGSPATSSSNNNSGSGGGTATTSTAASSSGAPEFVASLSSTWRLVSRITGLPATYTPSAKGGAKSLHEYRRFLESVVPIRVRTPPSDDNDDESCNISTSAEWAKQDALKQIAMKSNNIQKVDESGGPALKSTYQMEFEDLMFYTFKQDVRQASKKERQQKPGGGASSWHVPAVPGSLRSFVPPPAYDHNASLKDSTNASMAAIYSPTRQKASSLPPTYPSNRNINNNNHPSGAIPSASASGNYVNNPNASSTSLINIYSHPSDEPNQSPKATFAESSFNFSNKSQGMQGSTTTGSSTTPQSLAGSQQQPFGHMNMINDAHDQRSPPYSSNNTTSNTTTTNMAIVPATSSNTNSSATSPKTDGDVGGGGVGSSPGSNHNSRVRIRRASTGSVPGSMYHSDVSVEPIPHFTHQHYHASPGGGSLPMSQWGTHPYHIGHIGTHYRTSSDSGNSAHSSSYSRHHTATNTNSNTNQHTLNNNTNLLSGTVTSGSGLDGSGGTTPSSATSPVSTDSILVKPGTTSRRANMGRKREVMMVADEHGRHASVPSHVGTSTKSSVTDGGGDTALATVDAFSSTLNSRSSVAALEFTRQISTPEVPRSLRNEAAGYMIRYHRRTGSWSLPSAEQARLTEILERVASASHTPASHTSPPASSSPQAIRQDMDAGEDDTHHHHHNNMLLSSSPDTLVDQQDISLSAGLASPQLMHTNRDTSSTTTTTTSTTPPLHKVPGGPVAKHAVSATSDGVLNNPQQQHPLTLPVTSTTPQPVLVHGTIPISPYKRDRRLSGGSIGSSSSPMSRKALVSILDSSNHVHTNSNNSIGGEGFGASTHGLPNFTWANPTSRAETPKNNVSTGAFTTKNDSLSAFASNHSTTSMVDGKASLTSHVSLQAINSLPRYMRLTGGANSGSGHFLRNASHIADSSLDSAAAGYLSGASTGETIPTTAHYHQMSFPALVGGGGLQESQEEFNVPRYGFPGLHPDPSQLFYPALSMGTFTSSRAPTPSRNNNNAALTPMTSHQGSFFQRSVSYNMSSPNQAAHNNNNTSGLLVDMFSSARSISHNFPSALPVPPSQEHSPVTAPLEINRLSIASGTSAVGLLAVMSSDDDLRSPDLIAATKNLVMSEDDGDTSPLPQHIDAVGSSASNHSRDVSFRGTRVGPESWSAGAESSAHTPPSSTTDEIRPSIQLISSISPVNLGSRIGGGTDNHQEDASHPLSYGDYIMSQSDNSRDPHRSTLPPSCENSKVLMVRGGGLTSPLVTIPPLQGGDGKPTFEQQLAVSQNSSVMSSPRARAVHIHHNNILGGPTMITHHRTTVITNNTQALDDQKQQQDTMMPPTVGGDGEKVAAATMPSPPSMTSLDVVPPTSTAAAQLLVSPAPELATIASSSVSSTPLTSPRVTIHTNMAPENYHRVPTTLSSSSSSVTTSPRSGGAGGGGVIGGLMGRVSPPEMSAKGTTIITTAGIDSAVHHPPQAVTIPVASPKKNISIDEGIQHIIVALELSCQWIKSQAVKRVSNNNVLVNPVSLANSTTAEVLQKQMQKRDKMELPLAFTGAISGMFSPYQSPKIMTTSSDSGTSGEIRPADSGTSGEIRAVPSSSEENNLQSSTIANGLKEDEDEEAPTAASSTTLASDHSAPPNTTTNTNIVTTLTTTDIKVPIGSVSVSGGGGVQRPPKSPFSRKATRDATSHLTGGDGRASTNASSAQTVGGGNQTQPILSFEEWLTLNLAEALNQMGREHPRSSVTAGVPSPSSPRQTTDASLEHSANNKQGGGSFLQMSGTGGGSLSIDRPLTFFEKRVGENNNGPNLRDSSTIGQDLQSYALPPFPTNIITPPTTTLVSSESVLTGTSSQSKGGASSAAGVSNMDSISGLMALWSVVRPTLSSTSTSIQHNQTPTFSTNAGHTSSSSQSVSAKLQNNTSFTQPTTMKTTTTSSFSIPTVSPATTMHNSSSSSDAQARTFRSGQADHSTTSRHNNTSLTTTILSQSSSIWGNATKSSMSTSLGTHHQPALLAEAMYSLLQLMPSAMGTTPEGDGSSTTNRQHYADHSLAQVSKTQLPDISTRTRPYDEPSESIGVLSTMDGDDLPNPHHSADVADVVDPSSFAGTHHINLQPVSVEGISNNSMQPSLSTPLADHPALFIPTTTSLDTDSPRRAASTSPTATANYNNTTTSGTGPLCGGGDDAHVLLNKIGQLAEKASPELRAHIDGLLTIHKEYYAYWYEDVSEGSISGRSALPQHHHNSRQSIPPPSSSLPAYECNPLEVPHDVRLDGGGTSPVRLTKPGSLSPESYTRTRSALAHDGRARIHSDGGPTSTSGHASRQQQKPQHDNHTTTTVDTPDNKGFSLLYASAINIASGTFSGHGTGDGQSVPPSGYPAASGTTIPSISSSSTSPSSLWTSAGTGGAGSGHVVDILNSNPHSTSSNTTVSKQNAKTTSDQMSVSCGSGNSAPSTSRRPTVIVTHPPPQPLHLHPTDSHNHHDVPDLSPSVSTIPGSSISNFPATETSTTRYQAATERRLHGKLSPVGIRGALSSHSSTTDIDGLLDEDDPLPDNVFLGDTRFVFQVPSREATLHGTSCVVDPNRDTQAHNDEYDEEDTDDIISPKRIAPRRRSTGSVRIDAVVSNPKRRGSRTAPASQLAALAFMERLKHVVESDDDDHDDDDDDIDLEDTTTSVALNQTLGQDVNSSAQNSDDRLESDEDIIDATLLELEAVQQEKGYALSIIQPIGRGYSARRGLPPTDTSTPEDEDAQLYVATTADTTQNVVMPSSSLNAAITNTPTTTATTKDDSKENKEDGEDVTLIEETFEIVVSPPGVHRFPVSSFTDLLTLDSPSVEGSGDTHTSAAPRILSSGNSSNTSSCGGITTPSGGGGGGDDVGSHAARRTWAGTGNSVLSSTSTPLPPTTSLPTPSPDESPVAVPIQGKTLSPTRAENEYVAPAAIVCSVTSDDDLNTPSSRPPSTAMTAIPSTANTPAQLTSPINIETTNWELHTPQESPTSTRVIDLEQEDAPTTYNDQITSVVSPSTANTEVHCTLPEQTVVDMPPEMEPSPTRSADAILQELHDDDDSRDDGDEVLSETRPEVVMEGVVDDDVPKSPDSIQLELPEVHDDDSSDEDDDKEVFDVERVRLQEAVEAPTTPSSPLRTSASQSSPPNTGQPSASVQHTPSISTTLPASREPPKAVVPTTPRTPTTVINVDTTSDEDNDDDEENDVMETSTTLSCPATVTWQAHSSVGITVKPQGTVARSTCDPYPLSSSSGPSNITSPSTRTGAVVGPYLVSPVRTRGSPTRQDIQNNEHRRWQFPFSVARLGISRGSFAFQVKLNFAQRAPIAISGASSPSSVGVSDDEGRNSPTAEYVVPLAFVGLSSKHFTGVVVDTLFPNADVSSRRGNLVNDLENFIVNRRAEKYRDGRNRSGHHSRGQGGNSSNSNSSTVMMLRTSDGALVTSLDPNAPGTPYLPPYLLRSDGGATPIVITTHLSLEPGNAHIRFIVNGYDCGVAFNLILNPDPEPLFPCVVFSCTGDTVELQKPNEDAYSASSQRAMEVELKKRYIAATAGRRSSDAALPTSGGSDELAFRTPATPQQDSHADPSSTPAQQRRHSTSIMTPGSESTRLRIRSSHSKRNRLPSDQSSPAPATTQHHPQYQAYSHNTSSVNNTPAINNSSSRRPEYQLSPIRERLPPLVSPSSHHHRQLQYVSAPQAATPRTSQRHRGQYEHGDGHHHTGASGSSITPPRYLADNHTPPQGHPLGRARSGSEDPYGVFEQFRGDQRHPRSSTHQQPSSSSNHHNLHGRHQQPQQQQSYTLQDLIDMDGAFYPI